MIGDLNVCIIAYCGDILLSPTKTHMERLLAICDSYAKKWRMSFNPKNSSMLNVNVDQNKFYIGDGKIMNVNEFIYLGLPIGHQSFVKDYWRNKMRKAELASYALSSLGAFPNLADPFCFSFLYKSLCQSIFNYGLECVQINKTMLKEFDKRQAKIVKYNIGLSKYARNTPILNALSIKTITHLYHEHKINFLKHLNNNDFSRRMFKISLDRQSDLNRISFVKQLEEVSKLIDMEINLNNLEEAYLRLDSKFQEQNIGLLDSIHIFVDNIKYGNEMQHNKELLKAFLYVDFYNNNNYNNNNNNCE